jgi:hypothetical protein
MADDTVKKTRIWIPWSIAAIAVGINLYFSAVGYGQDKEKIADTAYVLKEHCKEQKAKEKETDTALNGLEKALAISQSQNGMILEALTALRKDMKDMEMKSWMREN